MAVSILTRPCGRVLRFLEDGGRILDLIVSILTRPCGRVLPSAVAAGRPRSTSFNPHPALRPGASVDVFTGLRGMHKFQSSPGLAAGCFRSSMLAEMFRYMFQSSPGLAAGCFL